MPESIPQDGWGVDLAVKDSERLTDPAGLGIVCARAKACRKQECPLPREHSSTSADQMKGTRNRAIFPRRLVAMLYGLGVLNILFEERLTHVFERHRS